MNSPRLSAKWLGAVLGTICAFLVLALGAHAADHRGSLTEEFHQTYAITPDGRVELDNINGAVHISSWDRNEARVDAIKSADTKEELDEAKIEIDSGKDYLSIRTRYPDREENRNWGSHNSAVVEYTLTVPRTIRLDEIRLINGALEVRGVSGEVRASCINGRLEVQNPVAGETRLSTVNGRLEARFDQLTGESVELNSVNGAVELTIPSDSNAELEASTVSGEIDNDFGLHVNHRRIVGHNLRGELGNGGTHIRLSDVNGRVEIHHAQDGRTLSPVKDRIHADDDAEM